MLNSPAGNPTPALAQPIMFTQEQYDQILKLLKKDTGDNSQHFAGTTKVTTLADKSKGENWIVDSGATNHMVHTRELLDKINTNNLKSNSKVHLPDGTSLDIACTRESRIGECGVIRNVLYILDFKYNLLSVSKLTRDLHCFLSFYFDFWIMQDLHNGKAKGIGKELEGLYNLQHK
ncbi:hypothetical protein A4A49_56907, partial [Nicotiana attenuata]